MKYETHRRNAAKLQDAYYSQLDARAPAERDDVLRQLRSMLEISKRQALEYDALVFSNSSSYRKRPVVD